MDSQILRDAISGDRDALSSLINKYKDIAFNLAISIVKNQEDAKDIIQESFLKVLENIHKFRNDSKFSTWLYKIVYNQSIGLVQKKGKMEFQDFSKDSIAHQMFETDIEIDRYKALYNAIDQLAEAEYTLIQLYYMAEKSIKDIHQITGMSVSNIKVSLHRARKKLAEKL
jgi:RNA polymerase sigma-70 factor (ECF subfamily)